MTRVDSFARRDIVRSALELSEAAIRWDDQEPESGSQLLQRISEYRQRRSYWTAHGLHKLMSQGVC